MGFLLVLILIVFSFWTLAVRAAPSASGLVRPTLLCQALLFVAASGWLARYVAGEDDYRRNGISRWEAYDAHGVTVAAIGAGLAVAALALLAFRRDGPIVRAVGLASVATAVLFLVAFAANSLN
jgi:hypothetical protein